ncbi:MAG: type II secretion system secretin GspD, partial [Kiritimatiellae bacterium]|nr:type II secretion system secretin GspD [Kiritimatiellia bacterium]
TQPDGHGAMPVIPYDESANALNFQDASADLVIMEYALRTGRTPIKDPKVPQVNITLRSTPDNPLTDEEYLQAIETALNFNGIALEPEGDKFLRVLPFTDFSRVGHDIVLPSADGDTNAPAFRPGSFITRVVELKYNSVSEVQPVINGLIRQGSQIQTLERNNAVMITDSADNVARIERLLTYLDRPAITLEEVIVRHIQNAKAADIKARLEELVKATQGDEQTSSKGGAALQERTTGAPGVERRPLPPGVMVRSRSREEAAPAAPTTETIASTLDEAARGIIRGKVTIVADERTNMLFLLTRPENMVFFDKMISELDVPTAPDNLAEVIRLEHAVAKDVATLLNDWISKRKTSDDDARPAARRDDGDKSDAPSPARTRVAQSAETRARIGQLDAENISILADERSNALLVTVGNDSDMSTLKSIIDQIDIQLAQVAIETVMIAISFDDTVSTGMDWVQRAMLNSAGKNGPSYAFASAGGGGTVTPRSATGLTATDGLSSISGGGVTGWFTFFDWNLDLVLRAVKSDSRARLMSAPVIVTLDNKEAVLEATKRIYWSEGGTHNYNSDYYTDNIKNEDVGIKLTVTPRINKSGYISLTIEQEFQDAEGTTVITSNDRTSEFPNLITRKMGADVSVQSGQTVVLGGLTQNSVSKTQSKVPLLGDIPLLGWFFRSETDKETRTELVVFITPRVLNTFEQVEDFTRGMKAGLDTDGVWDPTKSISRLADPVDERTARRVQERGRKTVAPPQHPLAGFLTGLNDETMLPGDHPAAEPVRRALEKAEREDRVPYIHFSEVDAAVRSLAPAEPFVPLLPDGGDASGELTPLTPEALPEPSGGDPAAAPAAPDAVDPLDPLASDL